MTNRVKSGVASSEDAEQMPVLAREPVMNSHNECFAYTLHFWPGNEEARDGKKYLESRVILDTSLLYGFERMTRGMPAFLPCPASLLTVQWAQMLPAKLAIVELEATAEPTDSLMAICRQLKDLGFRIALRDFAGERTPLLNLADFVKIDSLQFAQVERARLLGLAGVHGAGRVAENVETPGQYRMLQAEGFEFFEGYHFCHPEPVRGQKIPANHLIHLEILDLLQNEPFDLHRLAQLVACDASLTYRLLRLVNSPICAIRKEVTSIEEAILFVGQELFRRITTLAVATDLNSGQNGEILRLAFERASFCEHAAPLCKQTPSEQYLIGMVSLFPAMLRIDVEELMRMLPLRPTARGALEGRDIPEAMLLRWAVAHEHGDWAECNALARAGSMSPEELMLRYAQASQFAESALGASL